MTFPVQGEWPMDGAPCSMEYAAPALHDGVRVVLIIITVAFTEPQERENQPCGPEDQCEREHASALVLASLGASSADEENFSASDWSESSEWWSGTDSSGATLTPPSSEQSCGVKRKLDHVEGTVKPPRSSPRSRLTWPSLEFSPSLNPLEIRLNMGSRGNGESGQVTVARSVADVVVPTEYWKPNSDVGSAGEDTEVNALSITGEQTDTLGWTQEQGASQITDWPFLGSQASSLGLEEYPDTQGLSQMSGSFSW